MFNRRTFLMQLLALVIPARLLAANRKDEVHAVEMRIGFTLTDGEGHPIRPASGIRLQVRQFGMDDKEWPEALWPQIVGLPDVNGNLKTKAKFPVTQGFVHNMMKAVGL